MHSCEFHIGQWHAGRSIGNLLQREKYVMLREANMLFNKEGSDTITQPLCVYVCGGGGEEGRGKSVNKPSKTPSKPSKTPSNLKALSEHFTRIGLFHISVLK